MNNTYRAIIAVAIIVIAGGVAWYIVSGSGSAGGKTVATVNGTPITQMQLSQEEARIATQSGVATSSASQFQSQALNALIGTELLKQAAAKAGVVASSTAINAQLSKTKAQFSSTQAYQQALAAQGLTEAQLRSQIADSITISTFLNQQLNLSQATATPAQIQQLYNQQAALSTSTPPLAQVRSQIAQYIVQQQQQQMVSSYVSKLRSSANVKVLIATSTPSAPSTLPTVNAATTSAASTTP